MALLHLLAVLFWLATWERKPVRQATFSPDGRHLAVTTFRRGCEAMQVWDVRNRRVRWGRSMGNIAATIRAGAYVFGRKEAEPVWGQCHDSRLLGFGHATTLLTTEAIVIILKASEFQQRCFPSMFQGSCDPPPTFRRVGTRLARSFGRL